MDTRKHDERDEKYWAEERARFWAQFPPERHTEIRALIESAKSELDAKLVGSEERRILRLKEARENYLRQCAEGDERRKLFDSFESLEWECKSDFPVVGGDRWNAIVPLLDQFTDTLHFERYPNWRARAWRLKADLFRAVGDAQNELLSLRQAIYYNPKIPVKRRIKKLESNEIR